MNNNNQDKPKVRRRKKKRIQIFPLAIIVFLLVIVGLFIKNIISNNIHDNSSAMPNDINISMGRFITKKIRLQNKIHNMYGEALLIIDTDKDMEYIVLRDSNGMVIQPLLDRTVNVVEEKKEKDVVKPKEE